MHPQAPQQFEMYLPKWGVYITMIVTEKGTYHVVRQLCAVLGIRGVSDQVTKLRNKVVTSRYIEQFPVKTRTGLRPAWCLHQKALGYWLGFLDEKIVRPEVVPHLIEFQEDLLESAQHLLLGVVDSNLSGEEKIIRLQDWIGCIDKPQIPEDDGSDGNS